MSSGPDEALWEQDSQWQQWKTAVRHFFGKLQLLELCGGIGSAYIALSKLLPAGTLQLAGHWDIDDELAHWLQVVHSDCSQIHLGTSAGDILAIDIDQFPNSHIIVAGPPCPPWSKLGRRESFDDKRSAVLWRVIDIVTHQARTGSLGLFVVENVESLTHKNKAAGGRAPVNIILEDLNSNLPSGWNVASVVCDSMDFGVPQRRNRVYIVGHSVQLFGPAAFTLPLPLTKQVSLNTLLERLPAAEKQASKNTEQQQQNLDDWKKLYKDLMLDTGSGTNSVAVVDISRTPSGRTAWSSKAMHPDLVECLTASGPNLHVFALGEGTGELSIDRRMTGPERAALQGFRPNLCRLAGNIAKDKRIIGNAMTVPVIGAVMATELVLLMDKADEDTISCWLDGKAAIYNHKQVYIHEVYTRSTRGLHEVYTRSTQDLQYTEIYVIIHMHTWLWNMTGNVYDRVL